MPKSLIVDKNILRSEDEIGTFLAGDPSNRVVLTDFCCMECYKGLAEYNLPKSIAVLKKFASQVVILRGTREIVTLSLTAAGSAAMFIDDIQTSEFGTFCDNALLALNDNRALRNQLNAHAAEANRYLTSLEADAGQLVPAIVAIADGLPQGTLRRLRSGHAPTADDIEVFIPGMLALVRDLHLGHPDLGTLPPSKLLPQSFAFRFAVAGYLLAIEWIKRGGIEGVRPSKLGNDIVDMNYVAMATYFDGILTKDSKLACIYAEARWYVCDVFSAQT